MNTKKQTEIVRGYTGIAVAHVLSFDSFKKFHEQAVEDGLFANETEDGQEDQLKSVWDEAQAIKKEGAAAAAPEPKKPATAGTTPATSNSSASASGGAPGTTVPSSTAPAS